MLMEFSCDNQSTSNAYVSGWVGIERTAYNYRVYLRKPLARCYTIHGHWRKKVHRWHSNWFQKILKSDMIMRQESQSWEVVSMETSISFFPMIFLKLKYISTRAGGIYLQVIWPLVWLLSNGGDTFCWKTMASDLFCAEYNLSLFFSGRIKVWLSERLQFKAWVLFQDWGTIPISFAVSNISPPCDFQCLEILITHHKKMRRAASTLKCSNGIWLVT